MSIFSKIFGSSASPSLTRYEVGLVLAGSLIEGGDPNGLSSAESEFLQVAGISHGAYVQERFVLRASAASVSMVELLPTEAIRHEVGRGFLKWFADNAARSDQNALVAVLFKKRLPAYLVAAQQDRSKTPEPESLHFSQVSGRFAAHLLERCESAGVAEALCELFAVAATPVYWSAQRAATEALFRRVELIA